MADKETSKKPSKGEGKEAVKAKSSKGKAEEDSTPAAAKKKPTAKKVVSGASLAASAAASAAAAKAAAEERQKRNKLGPKLVCGAIAGVVGTSVVFPMALVKTRVQNQVPDPKTSIKPYRHVLDCAQQIVRNEGGWRGLYRGLGVNLIGVVPEKALKLAVNDYLRVHLQGDRPTIPLPYEILAGAGAGFCQVIATTPMERVTIQLQIAGQQPTLAGQAPVTGASVVKSLGLRGMYKGTVITLLRDVPFSFVYFPLYAQLKKHWMPEGSSHDFMAIMKAGLAAGAFSAGLVTPMDVIKTRLQVVPKPGDPIYTGIRDCYRQVTEKEGFRALYRGAVPRMLIVAPLFGLALSVYEFQQKYLA